MRSQTFKTSNHKKVKHRLELIQTVNENRNIGSYQYGKNYFVGLYFGETQLRQSGELSTPNLVKILLEVTEREHVRREELTFVLTNKEHWLFYSVSISLTCLRDFKIQPTEIQLI